ncbi:MAG TPA: hypothetical protein VFS05_03985 [Gemmatimonadaceae bacterium]|nr:hypothetical protein [Gemmatimonadaceae bacterium]
MSRRIMLVGATAAAMLGAACARTTTTSARAPIPPNAVMLRVENRSFSDMDLYATHIGLRYRVGSAPAQSTVTLSVPHDLYPEGTLRVIALPVGGSGRATTGPVTVRSGEEVSFTISPDFVGSSVSVR